MIHSILVFGLLLGEINLKSIPTNIELTLSPVKLGTLVMEVSGELPDDPYYLVFSLPSNYQLSESRVLPNCGQSVNQPINLPVFSDFYQVVAEQTSVQIVRWVKGEKEIYIKVNTPTSSWLTDDNGNQITPDKNHPAQILLGCDLEKLAAISSPENFKVTTLLVEYDKEWYINPNPYMVSHDHNGVEISLLGYDFLDHEEKPETVCPNIYFRGDYYPLNIFEIDSTLGNYSNFENFVYLPWVAESSLFDSAIDVYNPMNYTTEVVFQVFGTTGLDPEEHSFEIPPNTSIQIPGLYFSDSSYGLRVFEKHNGYVLPFSQNVKVWTGRNGSNQKTMAKAIDRKYRFTGTNFGPLPNDKVYTMAILNDTDQPQDFDYYLVTSNGEEIPNRISIGKNSTKAIYIDVPTEEEAFLINTRERQLSFFLFSFDEKLEPNIVKEN